MIKPKPLITPPIPGKKYSILLLSFDISKKAYEKYKIAKNNIDIDVLSNNNWECAGIKDSKTPKVLNNITSKLLSSFSTIK